MTSAFPNGSVLLSYGSEDMLKQVVHCYLHAGQTILLPRQSWWYYQAVAKEVFGKEAHYPMHERNGRFEYDLDEIVQLYEKHKTSGHSYRLAKQPHGKHHSAGDTERARRSSAKTR